MRVRHTAFILVLGLLAGSAYGSGHGPVFGFATPVNSEGEISFDSGVFFRDAAFGSQTEVKSMVSYGITPQIQASVVAPALVQGGSLPMSMMSGGEFLGNVAWRFHHQPNAVGRRFESTASLGVVVPGPQDDFGMFRGFHNAPGINGWIATGMASRSQYFWIGGGGMHFAESDGDQRPNVVSTSLVYGYRPPSWRSDRHVWDWRIFAEMTGEHDGHAQHAGLDMPGSEANQIFIGPSVLGIYKFFAVSGGVQFPVYSDLGRLFPHERMRLAINFSYFKFSGSHSH